MWNNVTRDDISEITNSLKYKDFIREVINEHRLAKCKGRKTITLPVIILYEGFHKYKTGVIRKLSESYKAPIKLIAHITINNKATIYTIPLCEDNVIVSNVGVHSNNPVFCIVPPDFDLELSIGKEVIEPNTKSVINSEFYYIKQMLKEVNEHDLDSIERIVDTLKSYVKKYK